MSEKINWIVQWLFFSLSEPKRYRFRYVYKDVKLILKLLFTFHSDQRKNSNNKNWRAVEIIKNANVID